jgi:hypothetical protein
MSFRLSTAGTPVWKLGLIPVLAAVLFKVTRPSAEVETPAGATAEVAQSEPAQVAAAPAPAMPELSLNDALKFDPFGNLPLREKVEEPTLQEVEPVVTEAVPTSPMPVTAAVNPLVEKAATLKSLKVSAVFPSSKGAMAIIDSKTVRAGDELSPGVKVVEIRGTNVILRVENGEAGASGETSGSSLH